MSEYLDEVRVIGNTDKYTVVKITTDKDTYTTRLPYTKIHRDNREDVYHYSISVRDWCRLRDIIVKDYFSFKLQRLINS